jgi:hypothetical protein
MIGVTENLRALPAFSADLAVGGRRHDRTGADR